MQAVSQDNAQTAYCWGCLHRRLYRNFCSYYDEPLDLFGASPVRLPICLAEGTKTEAVDANYE